MQPYHQESSILKDYALVIIFVHFVAALWIILNEAVVGVANVGLDLVAGTAADIINFLVLIYRIVPIGMIIGIWIYVFVRAVKREPYQQWVG